MTASMTRFRAAAATIWRAATAASLAASIWVVQPAGRVEAVSAVAAPPPAASAGAVQSATAMATFTLPTLPQLSLDAGGLNPAFSSETESYTSLVPIGTTNITFTTRYDVNGSDWMADSSEGVCTGTTKKTCPLAISGDTTLTVTVSDGSNARNYVIVVSFADADSPPPTMVNVMKLGHGGQADHMCAVLTSGHVMCSGSNTNGQLGLGDKREVIIPVTMPGVTDAIDVALGGTFTCVLRSGGGVRCTGEGGQGQLGNDGVASTTSLTDVLNESGTAPLTGATSLSVGSGQACAVVSGRVLCWGTLYSDNIYDENWNVIGAEGYSSTLPVELPGGPTDAVAVAVSDGSGCALRQTGNVVCWGKQDHGQLGNGVVEGSQVITEPVTVMATTGTGVLANVASLRGGDIHFCAVRTDGSQVCWGDNYYAQIAIGDIDGVEFGEVPMPTLTTMDPDGQPLTGVVATGPGEYHSCAATRAGYVLCSGGDYGGSLGNGPGQTQQTRAATVTQFSSGPPLTDVIDVVSIQDASCALQRQRDVYCWGNNFFGQMGVFSKANQESPVLVYDGQPPMPNLLEFLAFATFPPSGPPDPLLEKPTFVSTTKEYVLSLPITLTAFQMAANSLDDAGHPNMTYALKMGGSVIAPSRSQLVAGGILGFPAHAQMLNAGWNIQAGVTGTLVITSYDAGGTVPTVYTVTIGSAKSSNDAGLGFLGLIPGTLAPDFVSTTLRYTGTVPAGTVQTIVGFEKANNDQTVSIESSAGACTGPSGNECAVAAPKTWITVTVTAADATTEQYFIEITVADANASTDASLMDLTIDPGTLNPSFVSSTTSYAAGVPNGTTSAAVTATPSDANATVTYESSAGACALSNARNAAAAPANCAVTAPKTWITVTVTAEDGTTMEKYSIEITVAAGLTTIDRVWPGTGLPAGGMPVQIFGSGFAAALTVTVGPYDGVMIAVPFTIENDGQIDFVMPPGVAGQQVSVTVATAGDVQTAQNAFTYVQPEMIEFDGETGGVFTTTDGVVVTIPPQGVAGMFVITMTPLPPAPGVPGNILMYSFRLDALLNWVPLASLTNPVTITLPIDENIFAIADGERPWLYQWVGGSDSNRYRDRGRLSTKTNTMTIHSASAGSWSLVRGQEYDPGTQVMTVALRPMGVYALSTAYLRAYYLPLVPVLK